MIGVQASAGIVTLTVGGLPRLTRHDVGFGRELCATIRSFDDDDTVKVIVLHSADADFCVPTDVSNPGSNDWIDAYAGAAGLYQTWCFSRKVTVAAVAGRCAGAGTLLTLLADLAVAADNACFHPPFTDLPEASVVAAALTMGLNRAKAWMTMDAAMPAAAAETAGFVNHVVPRADLAAAARRLARRSGKVPLDGIAMSKLMVQAYLDSQGLGEEFDHVPFYAAAMQAAR